MVYLAKNFKRNKVFPLREISKSEDIPFDFLEKIILELEKSDLVKAKKGPNGGYFLACSPRKITAGDIVGALEKTKPVNCLICGRMGKCSAKSVWNKLEQSLKDALDSINLSELTK